jgi:hypothetical protein
MSKTWKELAEELKILAEVILAQAKRAFQEGDIDRGVLLTREFRSAIKTAGDLNMIAQGAGELETEFEDEDIERALGIEDLEEEDLEEDLEEEEVEDEIEEEEEGEEEEEDFGSDDIEEEAEDDTEELEASDNLVTEQKRKIVNQVGESLITLEQILSGIARKKI